MHLWLVWMGKCNGATGPQTIQDVCGVSVCVGVRGLWRGFGESNYRYDSSIMFHVVIRK